MISFPPALFEFIHNNASADITKLLLTAEYYPDIDIPKAVEQILARRQIKDKLPMWHSHKEIIYPSRIATEQCSSELTAHYKQKLLEGSTCCDLTGGLGVDTYYFSKKAKNVIYIERFPDYCECAKHNFQILGANNIHVMNADIRDIANNIHADTFYIDPARRNTDNKRMFALSDCEPDLLQLKSTLLENCQRLIIKISPMADIDETLRLLPETYEIHVIAVRNECKELLFVAGKEKHHEPFIHAVNLQPNMQELTSFTFTRTEEKSAPLIITNTLYRYLYEPNSAILKSGAFKLIAQRFGMKKLHINSHLYTSDNIQKDFPGRHFEIKGYFPFSGKEIKKISNIIPQANITTRNFPIDTKELRKRSKIKEGGNTYLFATTLADNSKILIQTNKLTTE